MEYFEIDLNDGKPFNIDVHWFTGTFYSEGIEFEIHFN